MLKILSIYIFCLVLVLTGCTTNHQPLAFSSGKADQTEPFNPHVKDAYGAVAMYSQPSAIKKPYRIIGKESISRRHFKDKQTAAINDLLKRVAASMGGDAIINVTQDEQKIEGTVISFERVLL